MTVQTKSQIQLHRDVRALLAVLARIVARVAPSRVVTRKRKSA